MNLFKKVKEISKHFRMRGFKKTIREAAELAKETGIATPLRLMYNEDGFVYEYDIFVESNLFCTESWFLAHDCTEPLSVARIEFMYENIKHIEPGEYPEIPSLDWEGLVGVYKWFSRKYFYDPHRLRFAASLHNSDRLYLVNMTRGNKALSDGQVDEIPVYKYSKKRGLMVPIVLRKEAFPYVMETYKPLFSYRVDLTSKIEPFDVSEIVYDF